MLPSRNQTGTQRYTEVSQRYTEIFIIIFSLCLLRVSLCNKFSCSMYKDSIAKVLIALSEAVSPNGTVN